VPVLSVYGSLLNAPNPVQTCSSPGPCVPASISSPWGGFDMYYTPTTGGLAQAHSRPNGQLGAWVEGSNSDTIDLYSQALYIETLAWTGSGSPQATFHIDPYRLAANHASSMLGADVFAQVSYLIRVKNGSGPWTVAASFSKTARAHNNGVCDETVAIGTYTNNLGTPLPASLAGVDIVNTGPGCMVNGGIGAQSYATGPTPVTVSLGGPSVTTFSIYYLIRARIFSNINIPQRGGGVIAQIGDPFSLPTGPAITYNGPVVSLPPQVPAPSSLALLGLGALALGLTRRH